jgi:hypothetical protein
VGEATLRAGGRRRGIGMQIVAGAGALFGVLFWRFGGPRGIAQPSALTMAHLIAVVSDPFTLLALALSVAFAAIHVRDI